MKNQENKKMPQMPRPASDKSDSLPHPGQPSVEGEGLDVPSHEEDLTGANGLSKHADAMLNPEKHAEDDERFVKPGYEDASKNASSTKAAAPRKGIEVVAMRKGFYNQQRYEPGDKFFIRSEEEFGEWMKAVEPGHEKKRVQLLREKKAASRRVKSGDEE